MELPSMPNPIDQPQAETSHPKRTWMWVVFILVGIFLVVWGIGYGTGLYFVDKNDYQASGLGGIGYLLAGLVAGGIGIFGVIISVLKLLSVSTSAVKTVRNIFGLIFLDILILFFNTPSKGLLYVLIIDVILIVYFRRIHKKATVVK